MKIKICPNYLAQATEFRHTWEGLANVDQFRWFVRGDMQEQLALAHRELKIKHVRAVGMLDDEMRVLTADPEKWREKEHGYTVDNPNWQNVTYVIERLLDMGICPMITTCFTPGVLADGVSTVFETKGRVNLPKDWDAWRTLIKNLVTHLIEHFGLETVREFYFEVWNEPNLFNFFNGTQADYFNLYKETAQTIKGVDAQLKIGGPSTARSEWIPEFLEFCRENDLEPEFIVGHIYNNDCDSKEPPLSPFGGPQEDQTSKSPNFASGVIRGMYELLESKNYKGEIHWNEWGRSWHPCTPVRESSNEAAFIVKTLAEVSQLATYFAYWCISDIYNQTGFGSRAFHGHYGLLSLQGLRKPGYQAHQLMSRLGTEQVSVASEGTDRLANAIATKSDAGYEIMTYSYDVAEKFEEKTVAVEIQVPKGSRVRGLYKLTQTENNIIHTWKQMGSPQYLKKDVLATLKDANELQLSEAFTVTPGDEMDCVSYELAHPGIALLEIAVD